MPEPPADAMGPPNAAEAEPTAALVLIGNELLSGKITDDNGPVAVRALRDHGVAVSGVEIVPDVPGRIAAAVNAARDRGVTGVITSGGVGPTHDDLTMVAIALAFGRPVERHAGFAKALRDYFGERCNEHTLRMADLPRGAELLTDAPNPIPVVRVENVYILPGDPGLFRLKMPSVATAVAGPGGPRFYGRRIYTDCDEPSIAGLLADVQAEHADVDIGSYPQYRDGGWRTLVTFDGRDEQAVEATFEACRAGLPADRITRTE